jgi:tetratricopeptide (TPR) repeat protein
MFRLGKFPFVAVLLLCVLLSTTNGLARPCLKSRDASLETVSTTCGSGWVRSCAATELLKTSVKAAHPPATAGGTNCVQRNFRLLRQSGLAIQNRDETLNEAAELNDEAVACVKDHQYQQAVDLLKSAIALQPKLSMAHYNLGRVYQMTDDLDLAIESFKHAVDLNSPGSRRDRSVAAGDPLKTGYGPGSLQSWLRFDSRASRAASHRVVQASTDAKTGLC